MERRRPTIAKEWQLAVLKKLQSESRNPTEGQRSAVAAETGLDEKWIKNWFVRQRSRNRKGQSTIAEPHQPRAHSTTVPTFKLQMCYPPAVPSSPQGPPSYRSALTPVDPGLYLPMNSRPRQPSPANFGSSSPHPSQLAPHTQETPRSHHLANPSHSSTPSSHTTTIPMYSRDPLYNRYPDFSQFFRPQVHERSRNSELSGPISNHNHLIQLLVDPNIDSHSSMHFQSLFNLLDPPHPGGLPTYQNSSANLCSCPVAFSMRLVDILSHP